MALLLRIEGAFDELTLSYCLLKGSCKNRLCHKPLFRKELAKLRKENKFDSKTYFKLYPSDAIPPQLY